MFDIWHLNSQKKLPAVISVLERSLVGWQGHFNNLRQLWRWFLPKLLKYQEKGRCPLPKKRKKKAFWSLRNFLFFFPTLKVFHSELIFFAIFTIVVVVVVFLQEQRGLYLGQTFGLIAIVRSQIKQDKISVSFFIEFAFGCCLLFHLWGMCMFHVQMNFREKHSLIWLFSYVLCDNECKAIENWMYSLK